MVIIMIIMVLLGLYIGYVIASGFFCHCRLTTAKIMLHGTTKSKQNLWMVEVVRGVAFNIRYLLLGQQNSCSGDSNIRCFRALTTSNSCEKQFPCLTRAIII